MLDFFVSYNYRDASWAAWVAWILEDAGFKVAIQAWDFHAGSNFVLEMQRAASSATRTLILLSPDYLRSEFAASEWAAAFASDPSANARKLVPIRIRECEPEGLLKPLVYIDLVGLEEIEARQRVIDGLTLTRQKPVTKPTYPGEPKRSEKRRPEFPSKGPTQSPVKTFVPPTDFDKREFVTKAFATVRGHFDKTLRRLAAENKGVQVDLREINADKFTAEVFVHGKSQARCTIWRGGAFGADAISFAEGTHHNENSFNELLSVRDGKGPLALSAMMGAVGRSPPDIDASNLGIEQAAEYLWARFSWTFE